MKLLKNSFYFIRIPKRSPQIKTGTIHWNTDKTNIYFLWKCKHCNTVNFWATIQPLIYKERILRDVKKQTIHYHACHNYCTRVPSKVYSDPQYYSKEPLKSMILRNLLKNRNIVPYRNQEDTVEALSSLRR